MSGRLSFFGRCAGHPVWSGCKPHDDDIAIKIIEQPGSTKFGQARDRFRKEESPIVRPVSLAPHLQKPQCLLNRHRRRRPVARYQVVRHPSLKVVPWNDRLAGIVERSTDRERVLAVDPADSNLKCNAGQEHKAYATISLNSLHGLCIPVLWPNWPPVPGCLSSGHLFCLAFCLAFTNERSWPIRRYSLCANEKHRNNLLCVLLCTKRSPSACMHA